MSPSDHSQPAPHDPTATHSEAARARATDPLADLPLPAPVDFSAPDGNRWSRIAGAVRRLFGARKAR